MKRIVLFALSILVLASCSIQKRRYLNGFYIENNNPAESAITAKCINKQKEKPQIKSEVFYSAKEPFLETSDKEINNTLSASTKTSPIIKLKQHFKPVYIERILKEKVATKTKEENNSLRKGLLAGGWIALIFGILITLGTLLFRILYYYGSGSLLFFGIGGGGLFLGILLILLGIGLLIWGYATSINSNSTQKDSDSSTELQDVVYLKNGGRIKGVIIEQIPNKSIKIQTKDGSIFHYNMDEIEKITKEKSIITK